jgi:hypothetical protein
MRLLQGAASDHRYCAPKTVERQHAEGEGKHEQHIVEEGPFAQGEEQQQVVQAKGDQYAEVEGVHQIAVLAVLFEIA